MTLRGGWKPRSDSATGTGGEAEGKATPKVLDKGWDDYIPPDAHEVNSRRRPASGEIKRDYRKRRSGGIGSVLRFALFALVVGSVVVGGLYFVARPIVVGGLVSWAAENPTAQKLPFISDIVRGEFGSELTEPVRAGDTTAIVIVINANATPHQIGDQLVAAGVITDARAFVFESIQKGVTEDFQIGRHVVSKSMTMDQIISALITPPVAPQLIRITFREGLRIEQMVAKMEYIEANPTDPTAPLKLDVAKFYDLVTNPPAALVSQYPWLKLPPGASLEGFLFPATYEVSPDITATDLATMLLDAFADHAPEGFLALAPDVIYRKVQLASLVENEAKVDSDRALIAGVYTNRLDAKKWPTGLLNADPTLLYAADSVWLQDPANPMSSWVNYTFWDTKLTSPLGKVVFPGNLARYNTYHYAGLPPSPICSPSAASLLAAMTPDTTDGYLYFLAKNDGSGTHAFAKTQAEQDANAKKYGY
jgi:UPF0755 protein